VKTIAYRRKWKVHMPQIHFKVKLTNLQQARYISTFISVNYDSRVFMKLTTDTKRPPVFDISTVIVKTFERRIAQA